MIKLILLSIIIVGICVFILSFNIIFRKDGKFPDGEISHNKNLVKQGIQCAKVEERILWKKKKNQTDAQCAEEACADCSSTCK